MYRPTPQIVPITPQGDITVTCPACQSRSVVAASAYRNKHAPAAAQCGCGHIYEVLIDTRSYYRKTVELRGFYTVLGDGNSRRMTVEDLSFTGLRFRTLTHPTLSVDDVVQISFHLDQPPYTEIVSPAVVRWTKDAMIGAEFCDQQAYRKQIGFYLMPT